MSQEIANDLTNDQWVFATHNYVLFAKDENTLWGIYIGLPIPSDSLWKIVQRVAKSFDTLQQICQRVTNNLRNICNGSTNNKQGATILQDLQKERKIHLEARCNWKFQTLAGVHILL